MQQELASRNYRGDLVGPRVARAELLQPHEGVGDPVAIVADAACEGGVQPSGYGKVHNSRLLTPAHVLQRAYVSRKIGEGLVIDGRRVTCSNTLLARSAPVGIPFRILCHGAERVRFGADTRSSDR